jgi:hypothetical protein
MKKLFVFLFLLLSGIIYGQERMSFEGLEFTLPQSVFEEGLLSKGWEWTENYCYKGTWLGREGELRLEWNGDNIENVTLLYYAPSEYAAISDFYNILDHYKELPAWRISEYCWILYQGQNEIILTLEQDKTTVKLIDSEVENMRLRIL